MTLDKHKLEGIPQIQEKTLPTETFEALLNEAGYAKLGEAPAKGNRVKIWWGHKTHQRVEVICSYADCAGGIDATAPKR